MLAQTEKLLGSWRGLKPLRGCARGNPEPPWDAASREPSRLSPVPSHPWAPSGTTPTPCQVLLHPPGPAGSKSNPALGKYRCINPRLPPSEQGFPSLSRDHFWEA